MGFSPTIRQQALIASARHCCVCHRYKGVKIEVHHISQEADGGPNTFENAIPLCFDCHSDAGHFNDRHPKGTKLSVSELIKARDGWYEYVKNNPLTEKLIISKHIQTSYYVLHSFEVLEAVIKSDFASVNKYRSKTYLLSNNISNQWNNLLQSHIKDYQNNIEQSLTIEVRQFSSIEEYCSLYNNVELIDKSSDEYPYYEAKRTANWADLLKSINPNSFFQDLSKSGIDAETFCTSLLYKNGDSCGGERPSFGYTEYLMIAPISFIFLGITNASKEQIKLNSLKTADDVIKLPNFTLLPYEMVLVPIATAINLRSIDSDSVYIEHSGGDRALDFSRVIDKINFKEQEVMFFKNKINPLAIIYNDNEGEYDLDIHEFDFNNLYSINSYWQCGSCPHLFFINKSGRQEYVRELLIEFSNKKGSDIIQVPNDIYKLVIRELEDEITYLDKIFVNGRLEISNAILNKGQYLTIDVKPFDKINIEGSYEPLNNTKPSLNDMWFRNEIIKQSNAKINLT